MRTAYKVLAYLVAAEVAVQGMVMVWAIAGLGKWVNGGGVFDKSVIEETSRQVPCHSQRFSASWCTASTGCLWSRGLRWYCSSSRSSPRCAERSNGPHRVWAGGGAGSARLPGP